MKFPGTGKMGKDNPAWKDAVQYTHESISHESVQRMRQGMDSDEQISGGEEPCVLEGVHGCQAIESQVGSPLGGESCLMGNGALPQLREAGRYSEKAEGAQPECLLQQVVQGKACYGSNAAHEQVRQDRNEVPRDGEDGERQPGMEGCGTVYA